ncbi:MAG: hypothetical protein K2K14_06300 [Ruminococcus sp.]|nr:hypothetical protein [Ruminococcus sp.]
MIYRLFDIRKFQNVNYPVTEMVVTDLILVIMCVMCAFRTIPFYIINFVIGCVVFFILNRELLSIFAVSAMKKLRKNK